MAKKLSNKQLLLLLVLCIAVITGYKYFTKDKGTRSFPTQVIELDSSAVTEVVIYPKSTQYKEVKLLKKGNGWKVDLGGGESAAIPNEKIKGLFQGLLSIKPERLAATKRKKWKEFEVDSLGTRVRVFQGDQVIADVVIGRFSFNQQARTATSYFRLFNDSNVYALNGFLEFTFNQNQNGWRDNTLISFDPSSVLQLNFVYQDSSYSIAKKDNAWFSGGGNKMDSVKVDEYLSSIANLKGTEFVNGIDTEKLANPSHSLRIETFDSGTIKIDAYLDAGQPMLVSNLNPSSCFNPASGNLTKTLFVGSGYFQELP